MDSNYIDLVLCHFSDDDTEGVFYAPGFSWLVPGDVVVVESEEGWTKTATIVTTLTVKRSDDAVLKFINRAIGQIPVLGKIKSKLSYIELNYGVREVFEYGDEETPVECGNPVKN